MRVVNACCAIGVSALLSGSVRAANPVVNGDFESPAGVTDSTPHPSQAWSFAPGPQAGDDAGIAPANSLNVPHADSVAHGQVGYLVDTAMMSQHMTLGAGTYTFSFQAATTPANYDPDPVTLELLNSGNSVVKSVTTGVSTPQIGTAWQTYQFTTAAIPAGTYALQISTSLWSPSDDFAAVVDNVIGSPVGAPEPGTMTLAGIAVTGLMLRRRRA